MSADCNIPAVSALLLSLEFKFVPIFKKNAHDTSIEICLSTFFTQHT